MDIMYAQVEQARAIQDYPPFRPCVRLVGIDAVDFGNQAFNMPTGCKAHFIDIASSHLLEAFAEGAMHDPPAGAPGAPGAAGCCWPFPPGGWPDDWPDRLWIELGYQHEPRVTGAYLYELFSDDDKVHDISIHRLRLLTGPAVQPPPLAATGPMVGGSQAVDLSAFHVGQGMCALLRCQKDGILLDAGAGTPVRRGIYRQSLRSPTTSPFVNDLRTATANLRLQAIISHPDSDHWRLLDWDLALLASTNAIYTPHGAPALALKARQVIAKVHSLAGRMVVTNGAGGKVLLDVHRSSPAVSDRNGECLVVQAHSGPGCKYDTLLPGDYVYDRMAADHNADIRALSSASFDAVMVPHHGDAASAAVLVSPTVAASTVAFFSAGTHTGYKHPTQASLQAHQAAGFRNIDRHTCTDIIEHPLP